mgnify:CR=1 FL=1
MADGSLNFDTRINTDGFNKALSAIERLVKGTGGKVSDFGKAFIPVMDAVTKVGSAAARTTIDLTKLYESTMVVFEKMLGGKDAANELCSSLLSIAKASAFSQEAILTAGKKQVGMGVNAQDTSKYIQAITDAIAGFGGTSDNLTNVAEIFAKISTAGRLSMEDVNMLSDNGIQALKILGNQYGKTTDEIQEMISNGTIPAKDAMDKLAEGIEEGTDGVNGMTAAMKGMALAMKGKTLTGTLDSLNIGFQTFCINLTKINPTLKANDEGYAASAEYLQQLTAAISAVAEILPSVSSLFDNVTEGIGLLLDKVVGTNEAFDEATGTCQNVGDILGFIQEKLKGMDLDKLKQFGSKLLKIAAAGAKEAITGLPDIFDNLVSVARNLGNLKDAILLPFSEIPGVVRKLLETRLVSTISDTLSGIPGRISEIFGRVSTALRSRFSEIMTNLSGLSSYFGVWRDKVSTMFETLSRIPGRISEVFGRVSTTLRSRFSEISTKLSEWGSYISTWGDMVGEAFQEVIKSIGSFAPGFIGMLKFGVIAGALVAGLGLLQGQFGEQIGAFLQLIAQKGPEIISNLCEGISSCLPSLIAQGVTLIQNLLQAITANIPAIISGGMKIIAGLVEGIGRHLPTLIPMALRMILTIVQSLLHNLPQLISAGLQLASGVNQGLINAIPLLISAVPVIIRTLVSSIVKSLPDIILVGIQLLIALVNGIIQAIPELLAMIPEIFTIFAEEIMSVDWLSVGKQILTAIVGGIKSIGSSLWDAVTEIFDDGEGQAEEKGKSTGEKYAQGMESTTVDVQDSASTVATAAAESFAFAMDANSGVINEAAWNMGNTANNGLQMADIPTAFNMDAQDAVGELLTTLNESGIGAFLAAQSIGTEANLGISSADMDGTFSYEGMQAGQELSYSLSGQTGAVSDAASQVAGSAEDSLSNIDLSGSYSNVGLKAMQSLVGSITSSSPSISCAAKDAAMAAITGLTSAQMPDKAKQESEKFIKSLESSIKSGIGTVKASVTAVMDAAKAAVNGLSEAGYSAGQMFSVGLANGIRSGQNGIAAAAAEVARAAVYAAKQNLDINSPSKVGTWIGEMFDTGIAKGISGNLSGIRDSVGRMTGAIEDGTFMALNYLRQQAVQGMRATVGRCSMSYGQSQAANKQAVPIYVQTKATLMLQDGRVIAEVTTPYVDANIGSNVEKKGRYLK